MGLGRWVAWVAAVAAASCTTFEGLELAGPKEDGAVTSDAMTNDGAALGDEGSSAEASSGDAGADAADAEGDAGRCPATTAGPAMVDVGPFCIDSTEVTNAHYAAFLAQATAATIAAQPAQCAFNTTFVPNNAWPAALNKPTEPVAYVNWCDAYAYCAWAGKRMCGKVGGGSLTAGDFANTATSQWTYACTHAGDGQHAYPYGATYAPQACNGADRNADAGTLTPAGALATCVGGYPGIFDMSGNVGEFMDACSAATGAADTCHIGGGDANDALASVPCAHSIVVTRAFTSSKKGIRCCSL